MVVVDVVDVAVVVVACMVEEVVVVVDVVVVVVACVVEEVVDAVAVVSGVVVVVEVVAVAVVLADLKGKSFSPITLTNWEPKSWTKMRWRLLPHFGPRLRLPIGKGDRGKRFSLPSACLSEPWSSSPGTQS